MCKTHQKGWSAKHPFTRWSHTRLDGFMASIYDWMWYHEIAEEAVELGEAAELCLEFEHQDSWIRQLKKKGGELQCQAALGCDWKFNQFFIFIYFFGGKKKKGGGESFFFILLLGLDTQASLWLMLYKEPVGWPWRLLAYCGPRVDFIVGSVAWQLQGAPGRRWGAGPSQAIQHLGQGKFEELAGVAVPALSLSPSLPYPPLHFFFSLCKFSVKWAWLCRHSLVGTLRSGIILSKAWMLALLPGCNLQIVDSDRLC